MDLIENSKLEKIVRKHLGKDFKHAICLNGYRFDFLSARKKIAVEVQGCWHHACKKCFPKARLMLPQIRSIKNDARKMKAAHAAGYKVVKVWEHELR